MTLSRLENKSYCDAHGNCLPALVGTLIPLASYGLNCLSFILAMLDTIQPETNLEKLETVSFTWANFSVRVLVLVLSLSHLTTLSTLVFLSLALSLEAVYLHCFSIPARFSKLSTWALSPTTTTLVVENISKKERGWDSERSQEEKKNIRRCLGFQAVLNLIMFAAFGTLVCSFRFFNIIKTDTNNILSNSQTFSVYLYVLLPLTVVNLLSCLNNFFLPAFSVNKVVQTLSAAFNSCLFLSSILIPIISGVFLVPPSPRDIFVLVKVTDSLSIYPATTHSNYTWDLDQVWRFDNETVSLHHSNHQLFMVESDETPEPQSPTDHLSLSRGLTDFDRNNVFQPGTVYITQQLNPIDWNSKLFM